jgi:hypothetical protein
METTLMLLKLIPAIIAAIRAIEDALPVAGAGADKLNAILDTVKAADEKVDPGKLAKVVSVFVALFKKFGVFGGAPATSPTV